MVIRGDFPEEAGTRTPLAEIAGQRHPGRRCGISVGRTVRIRAKLERGVRGGKVQRAASKGCGVRGEMALCVLAFFLFREVTIRTSRSAGPHGRLGVRSPGRREDVFLHVGTPRWAGVSRGRLSFLFPSPRSWGHAGQAARTARPQAVLPGVFLAQSQALGVSFPPGLDETGCGDPRYVGWRFNSSLLGGDPGTQLPRGSTGRP